MPEPQSNHGLNLAVVNLNDREGCKGFEERPHQKIDLG